MITHPLIDLPHPLIDTERMKSTEEALGKNFAELLQSLLPLLVLRHTRKHVFELVRLPVHKLQHLRRVT